MACWVVEAAGTSHVPLRITVVGASRVSGLLESIFLVTRFQTTMGRSTWGLVSAMGYLCRGEADCGQTADVGPVHEEGQVVLWYREHKMSCITE